MVNNIYYLGMVFLAKIFTFLLENDIMGIKIKMTGVIGEKNDSSNL